MSEKSNSPINDDITIVQNKENLFHLTPAEITYINKLFPNGYKIVDETDKDIQQFLRHKRIQERKLKKKKYPSPQQIIIDRKKLTEKIRLLPDEQLKGILNIIDLRNEIIEQKEFYELNIESLNQERLLELQKYVRSCFKSAGDSIPARYLEEFKKNKSDYKEENIETI